MLTAPSSLSNTAVALGCGQISVLDYVHQVCDRTDAIEPEIKALLPEPGRRDRLAEEAAALQTRFPDPALRPPLYGIPVGIKDLFNVDGFQTRAGSRLPAELFSGSEASFVGRLRSSGALILGKTAMDEFAHSEPAPTRNPHNPAHTPGGSSSGSAAAVAAGLCPLTIGSQTLRSTIGPAAFCGIVGFKPSYGRIPADGMVLMAGSFDTVGLFCQDLLGMALAASILYPDWQPVVPPERPVLGIPEGFVLTSVFDNARGDFEAQLGSLEGAGYEIRRVAFSGDRRPDLEAIHEDTLQLLRAEMAQVHAEWFRQYRELYRPRTVKAILDGQAISRQELDSHRKGQHIFRAELEALMAEAGVDLWVLPSSRGPAPEGLEVTGWVHTTAVWCFAGLPVISLPAGLAPTGLPLGLQLVGPFGSDEQLLAWAPAIARTLWHAGERAWYM